VSESGRCLPRENGVKRVTEFLVIIPNEKPNGRIAILEFPHHLTGLLGDPGVIRMSRAACEMHPAAPNFDEHEDVNCVQKQGFDGEKNRCHGY